ncbi:MAG: hypothetical protein ABIN01_01340 [Ferruginibacter sp.]
MSSRKEQKINEFCKEGNLEDFREVLALIIEEMEKSGCRIYARYNENRSSHEFFVKDCCMRICLKDIYNEPVELIWTILHEFGHHLSGRVKFDEIDSSTKINREKIAWEKARPFVLKFPLLAEKIKKFDSYAEECLKGYINGLKISLPDTPVTIY